MELNEKQLHLCLEHAFGQFLHCWQYPVQDTWQRMQGINEVNPDISGYEEPLGISLSDRFEHTVLDDLVSMIESAYDSNQELIRQVFQEAV